MATVTQSYNTVVNKGLSSTLKFYTPTFGKAPLVITTTDTVLILQFNFVEQVATVTSFEDKISQSGVTLDTLAKHFRVSTNGTTFGAWTLLTNPNLAALVINSALPFYIQVRYTRTLVDSLGDFYFHYLSFTGTFLSTAAVLPALWNNLTYVRTSREVLMEVIQAAVKVQFPADYWHVRYQDRNSTNEKLKPVIYFQSFSFAPKTRHYCAYEVPCTITFGIKRRIDVKGYEEQMNFITELFNPFVNYNYTHDITYNSVVYFGCTLADFGICNAEIGSMVELTDAEGKYYMNEFNLNFTLTFNRR